MLGNVINAAEGSWADARNLILVAGGDPSALDELKKLTEQAKAATADAGVAKAESAEVKAALEAKRAGVESARASLAQEQEKLQSTVTHIAAQVLHLESREFILQEKAKELAAAAVGHKAHLESLVKQGEELRLREAAVVELKKTFEDKLARLRAATA